MRKSPRIQRNPKVLYLVFTPRILILAIREALKSPLRPIAPRQPAKEANTAAVKASSQPPYSTESPEEDSEPESLQSPSDCPERALWVAVLKQAILDAKSKDLALRSDALAFFESYDFLKVLDYAGIDRDLAPGIRAKVRSLKPRNERTLALAA